MLKGPVISLARVKYKSMLARSVSRPVVSRWTLDKFAAYLKQMS